MMAFDFHPVLAEWGTGPVTRWEQRLADPSSFVFRAYMLVLLIGLFADAALLIAWRSHAVAWRTRIHRLLWRPWGGRELLALLALLGTLQLVLRLLVAPLRDWTERQGIQFESAILIAETLVLHVVGLGVVALLLVQNRLPWRSAFGMSRSSFASAVWKGAIGLVALMPPFLFYSGLYRFILHMLHIPIEEQEVLFTMSETTSLGMRIFFVLLAAVLAPLFEEIFFRGILLPVLAQRMRLDAAVCIVSAFFAIVHWNTASLVPLFILSVSFCLAYIHSESLWVPIVMHSLFNLSTVAVLFSS